jgi:hypothetical protein
MKLLNYGLYFQYPVWVVACAGFFLKLRRKEQQNRKKNIRQRAGKKRL